jgi:hypothetical protein
MVIAYIEYPRGDKKALNALYRAQKSEETLNKYVISNGEIITTGNYLNEWRKYKASDIILVMDGNPISIYDKIALALHRRNLSYFALCENHPEDKVESRTSWYDMEEHADNLRYTLSEIIEAAIADLE